uniref:Uncharacterized protein n=1 Tax=Hanusia phi TaxID=3032 RepID=A0A7S0HRR2_9CRYP|mmetsp:Transcript_34108/g.76812  ORF Transcript_34108/g.76812 Transcript_34108/m.76812 type:complete len:122 (+) Transcript_34108:403-768(+)
MSTIHERTSGFLVKFAMKRCEPSLESQVVIINLTTEQAMKEVFYSRKTFRQDETQSLVAVGVSLDKDSVRVNHLVWRDQSIPSQLMTLLRFTSHNYLAALGGGTRSLIAFLHLKGRFYQVC